MQQTIEEKLKNKFSLNHLRVVNESAKHKGHSGDDGSGESHFWIEIGSKTFENKKSIDIHKDIYACLAEEMKIIHALRISLKKE